MNAMELEGLRPIGLTQAMAQQCAQVLAQHEGSEPSGGHLLRVVEVHRETLLLHDGSKTLTARMLPRLQKEMVLSQQALSVGDWVLASVDDYGQFWVCDAVPPLTHLARRDAQGRRQHLVSNIDTVFLVMAMDHDFSARRLERYLALVQGNGVFAVLVLTKADGCTDPQAMLDGLRGRVPASLPIHQVDGRSAHTAMALAPYLTAGQTVVLLGSSGAGKSTLTNTLLGDSIQDTGAVRADDSRGRHTTTARSLHLLPGGACLIDTPGLRTLKPDLDEAELAASFADIDALAAQCRFRDCQHNDEPGCAVRAGIEPDRLINFKKMLRDARRDSMTALDKQAAAARWKAISKGTKAWMKIKRGAG